MRILPRRPRRYRRPPLRSPDQAVAAPAPSPGSADGAVARAEDVVRDTWLRTLRDECRYTAAELQAAAVRCDAARRYLAAALLGRVPEVIAGAHADLDGKLVAARIAARAYAQAREVLAAELGLADGQVAERYFDERFGGWWTPGRPEGFPAARGSGWSGWSVRAVLALGWLSQHRVLWTGRLATSRRR